MNYPHSVIFTRPSGSAGAVDPESGMPVSVPTATTVYSGKAWVQDDSRVIGVSPEGDAIRQSDAVIYLPAGEWGIQSDDEVTVTGRSETGRVVSISLFTSTFYTQVRVRWR